MSGTWRRSVAGGASTVTSELQLSPQQLEQLEAAMGWSWDFRTTLAGSFLLMERI
jgi:hypothetical protein